MTTHSDEDRARHIERTATVMRVWQRMVGKFGNLWISAMGSDAFDDLGHLTPTSAEWLHGLRGLTRRQIYDAMDRLDMLGTKHPPTLPEFRSMAWNFPPISEVDDYLHARGELTPFNRAVAGKLDLWKWRKADQDEAMRRLKAAYLNVCEEIQAGRKLPELEKAISHKTAPRDKKPSHVGYAHIDKINAILGISTKETDEETTE